MESVFVTVNWLWQIIHLIFFFDHQWNFLRIFTHPSVSALHEILYVEDGVWVTSTANDLLVKFNMDGLLSEYYPVREQSELMKKLNGTTKQALRPEDITTGKRDFRKRPYFNSDVYDRTHLNSIALVDDGGLLLSLGLIVGNRYSFLITIKKVMLKIKVSGLFLKVNRILHRVFGIRGTSAIVRFDLVIKWKLILRFPTTYNPSHSICIMRDNTGIYLDTSAGSIVHFDLTGSIISKTKITDKFLRGVLELPDKRLAIGAGNILLIYDLAEQKIIKEIEFSDESLNTVFDIKILPSNFELPPSSLEFVVGRIAGFENQKIIWAPNTNENTSPYS